jgi:hypothetical protein
MIADWENALRGALRQRAEADTDAVALLARIGPAYRRRRGRRLAGLASSALAVGVLLTLLVPRLLATGYAVPAPPLAPSFSAGAAAIGSDPETIHFDVGAFPYRLFSTRWAVDDGLERLSLWGATDDSGRDDAEFMAELTLTPGSGGPAPNATGAPDELTGAHTTTATVGGRPAVVVTGVSVRAVAAVSWSPAPGVRAALVVHGPVEVDRVLAFAGTLNLERGHRCSVRVHTTVLPAGARLAGCETIAGTGGGQLVVRGGGGTVTISVPATTEFQQGAGTGSLANGWAYQVLDPSSNTQHWTAFIRVTDPYLEVYAQGGYGLADVLLVAGGLQPS